MTDIDDHGLVNGLRANDPISQKMLVDRYAGRLLSIVISLGLSYEDGREVVNDSLYKVVKNINKFDLTRGSKFTSWIVRIAINTARDKYKQLKDPLISQSTEQRAERGIQDVEMLWQEQHQADSELGQLSQQILSQALDSLSENDQDILRYCACGFQQKEIATLMSKTPGAIKIGHHRAKERLKQRYLSILESLDDKHTATVINDFLGIEAVNEETQN